jgi:hypothetical protein
VKYFTPDLLAQCRSLDPEVAEAAAAKWQRRAAAYRKRIQEIQQRLPLGARRLMRTLTLHDAYLLSTNLAKERGRTQFFLSFKLSDGDGRAGVQLRYDLAKPLKVVLHERAAPAGTVLFALYDEFDAKEDGALTHSILMTGGVEARVRFTNLVVTHFTRVVAPGRGRSDVRELAEMAAS